MVLRCVRPPELRYKPDGSKYLEMKTCQGRETENCNIWDQKQAVNLVKLSITKSGTDFKITLNAFAVPQICKIWNGLRRSIPA